MSGANRAPSEPVDVCVIGTGPAGASVGHRLATDGFDVTFLEAGPWFEEEPLARMERGLRPNSFEAVWDMGGPRDRYTVGSGQGYGLNRRRVKGVGGTSLHWSGLAPRFHEADFERQTRHGYGRDWPISYSDLQPYYAEAEQLMGVSGADDNPYAAPRAEPYPNPPFPPSHSDSIFAEACEELGIDMHSVPRAINYESYDDRSGCQAYGTCGIVCPSGAKYTAKVHVRRAEEAGARVIDRAQVQRLEHDSSGDTIDAAVYATPDGTEYRQEARWFVVACGAVESARLLLLSRSNAHPDGLANGSDAVGRYLMTHPKATVNGVIDRHTGQNRIGFATSMTHQFYEHTTDSPGSFQLLFHNNAGATLADLMLGSESILKAGRRFAGDPTDGAAAADMFGRLQTTGEWGDDLIEGETDDRLRMLGLPTEVEQLPDPSNRVTLNTDVTDNHGNAVPHIQMSAGRHARSTIEDAIGVQKDILSELDADIVSVPDPATPRFSSHQMGTTRMGDDPAESVTDRFGVTHELSNLAIASAGVFVTSSAVNPTLTIVALALRTADRIRELL